MLSNCEIFQLHDYEISLYRDWPDSLDLKNSWHTLVVESPSPNIFLTCEWMSLWWKWFGEKGNLRLFVFNDATGVAAIVPLHIHRSRLMPGVNMNTLRFVGDGGPVCPDFLSPVLSSSRNVSGLVEVIGKAILSYSGNWAYVCFSDVLLESPGIEPLVGVLERSCKKEIASSERAPYLTLPENYDLFLASLGSRQRESIRRRLRQAKKRYNVRMEGVTSTGVDSAISDLLTVFKSSKRGLVTNQGFNRTDYLGFHAEVIKTVAKNGWLRLLILYFDDVPVAFLYGYKFEQAFFFYQTGYDLKYSNDGAGSIMLQLSIELAIEEHCSTYEFLRGTEDYKYHFSKEERNSVTITLWSSQGVLWYIQTVIKRLAGVARKVRLMLSSIQQSIRH